MSNAYHNILPSEYRTLPFEGDFRLVFIVRALAPGHNGIAQKSGNIISKVQ